MTVARQVDHIVPKCEGGTDDDANLQSYNEGGRIQALDELGNVVAETTFSANSSDGTRTVQLEHATGFSAVVVTAGTYDNQGNFNFGAYVDDAGSFATAPYSSGGALHGSDFLIHNVEFELALIGVAPDPI